MSPIYICMSACRQEFMQRPVVILKSERNKLGRGARTGCPEPSSLNLQMARLCRRAVNARPEASHATSSKVFRQ